jgi:hypothetical protein
VKIRIFIFFFIFLFGWLISCNNDPAVHSLAKTEKNISAPGPNKVGDTNKQKLSSMLYELAVSQEPDDFAKKHDIFLDRNRVRVYIFFEPSASHPVRTKILEDHNIMVEKSSNDLTRGLVPVDHLIFLSEEPVIRFIKLPDRLIKTRKTIQ